jgi:threonine dehydratase
VHPLCDTSRSRQSNGGPAHPWQRIVHGYSQLFYEVDSQLPHAQSASHVVVPVGVGSLAHAAVLWYGPTLTDIITVEPTTAACLRTSLLAGEITPIETGHTIMPGLNCGTVSHLAWPDLRGKIKLENALVVGDDELGGDGGTVWGSEHGGVETASAEADGVGCRRADLHGGKGEGMRRVVCDRAFREVPSSQV